MSFIKIDYDVFCQIQGMIIENGYVDYDDKDIDVIGYVGFHDSVKLINNNDKIINIHLLHYKEKLKKLYKSIEQYIKADCSLSRFDSHDIIDYILYSMNIKTIETLNMNMRGYKRLTLMDYCDNI